MSTYLVPDGLYYKLNASAISVQAMEFQLEIAELKYKSAKAHHESVEAEFHAAITENGKYETVGEVVIDETHRSIERKLVTNE